MKKIVKKVVAKKAPVKKLVKAQKGISTGKRQEVSKRQEVGKDIIKKDPPYKFATKEARDSSRIYGDRMLKMKLDDPLMHSTVGNYIRQYNKGQAGYDKMGYKKDKWGRSKDDKWFGFDPKTKKYTTGPNQGKTHGQVMKSRTTKK